MRPFLDFDGELPLPRVSLLAFQKRRTAFTHATETLSEWVMLGAEAGEFRYRLGSGTEGICRMGDFVLCPPGVALSRAIEKVADFYSVRFSWKPPVAHVWQGQWTLRDSVRMASTLEQLRVCHETLILREPNAWANHLLLDLLGQLAIESLETPVSDRPPDRLMQTVRERMRRDLSKPTPLAELAREAGLNPFQLSRRFTLAYGVSPTVYRTRLRIQHARRLLLETDWTTDRIAEACGFENAFYFSRVFTRQTGQPPRNFRRDHRV